MKFIVLTAIFEPEGEYYNALCKELGVASFGKSLPEAFQNLREATKEYLNTLNEYGEALDTLKKKGVEIS